MAKQDSEWVAARTGTLGTKLMEKALRSMAAQVGATVDDLAMTRVSRTEDPFHVLVACIISLRTKDEVTDVAAPRLLDRAGTPAEMSALESTEIARLIYPAGFYNQKARQILEISRRLVHERSGQVPSTLEQLLTLPGVGRKTANLVLSMGFAIPAICVDTHVHRITNRLGYVRTREPNETELVLRANLPRRWWIPINETLVSFGRTVCCPTSPKCSICRASSICQRVGVVRSR